MQGLLLESVPGRASQHIPIDIDERGRCNGRDEDDMQHDRLVDDKTSMEQPYKNGNDCFHASQRTMGEFGIAEGCQVCRAIQNRRNGAGRMCLAGLTIYVFLFGNVAQMSP